MGEPTEKVARHMTYQHVYVGALEAGYSELATFSQRLRLYLQPAGGAFRRRRRGRGRGAWICAFSHLLYDWRCSAEQSRDWHDEASGGAVVCPRDEERGVVDFMDPAGYVTGATWRPRKERKRAQ